MFEMALDDIKYFIDLVICSLSTKAKRINVLRELKALTDSCIALPIGSVTLRVIFSFIQEVLELVYLYSGS